MNTSIADEVLEQLKGMPEELQKRVLQFTRSLAQSTPRGVPGQELLRFAGAIPPEEANVMSEAIERGCEQVDIGEW